MGAGWNLEEMRNHGTEPQQRFAIIEDLRIKAMQEMWVEDQASFHGRYVDFDRIAVWPGSPCRRHTCPSCSAATARTTEQRVLDHGDGWAPYTEPGIADRGSEVPVGREARAGRDVSVTLVAPVH